MKLARCTFFLETNGDCPHMDKNGYCRLPGGGINQHGAKVLCPDPGAVERERRKDTLQRLRNEINSKKVKAFFISRRGRRYQIRAVSPDFFILLRLGWRHVTVKASPDLEVEFEEKDERR